MSTNANAPPVVSPELVVKIDEINSQWLIHQSVILEAYLQSDEYSDNWKLRIVSTFLKDKQGSPVVILDYLDPSAADGHTYMLFVSAFKDKAVRDHELGMATAVARITAKLCEAAGCSKNDVHEIFEKNFLKPSYR